VNFNSARASTYVVASEPMSPFIIVFQTQNLDNGLAESGKSAKKNLAGVVSIQWALSNADNLTLPSAWRIYIL
jgi:hypothetical protein